MSEASNITRDGIEVRPGQVWMDLDKRMDGRCCKVVSIYAGYAKMRRCTDVGTDLAQTETRVAVRRMHK